MRWGAAAVVFFELFTILARADDGKITLPPQPLQAAPVVSPAAIPADAAPKLPATFSSTNITVTDASEETRTVAVGMEYLYNSPFPLQATPKAAVDGMLNFAPTPSNNPSQLLIYPLRAGTTSVTFTGPNEARKKINFNITEVDLSQKVAAMRDLLFDVEGIVIKIMDNKIIVDGEIIVPHDLDRLLGVIGAFNSEKSPIVNLVSLSKVTQESLAKKIQEKIRADGDAPNVEVFMANETFVLKGTVDSSAARDRAELIATTYIPDTMGSATANDLLKTNGIRKARLQNLIDVISNPTPPAKPKMVRVTYHFVEISKEFLKSSFFRWAPLAAETTGVQFGQSTTGGVASKGSFAGTITSLIPKLEAGSNGGFARILFSTVELGKESTEMKFTRTTFIPFIDQVVNGIPSNKNQQVTLRINVTPRLQGDEAVELNSTIHFDAVSGATAQGAQPRMNSTELQNTLIIKNNESAVLGGLISSDTAKDIDKDPTAPAQNGSPIFNLLRSKAFRNNKTQFVVFLTPKIIEDAAADTVDIKSKIINNNRHRQRSLR